MHLIKILIKFKVMTDKQKEAIKILNRLITVEGTINENEYFALLEFVVDQKNTTCSIINPFTCPDIQTPSYNPWTKDIIYSTKTETDTVQGNNVTMHAQNIIK